MKPTCRFDWYAATVRADPVELLSSLADALGGEIHNGKPKQGYARGDFVKRNGSTVATMYSGGRNGHPHVFASSDETQPLVDFLRSSNADGTPRWRHHVTRMDAAYDFDGEGTWDRLFPVVRDLALGDLDENGEYQRVPGDTRRRVGPISVAQQGDWINTGPDGPGRTFYVGSFQSAVLVYLYEKGKQQRGRAIDGGADISPNWVRLEARIRPDGPARLKAASSAPESGFGYADWSRELLRRVLEENVERTHIKARRESDHERAMHWLIRQYGEHLATEADMVGGWENLARSLERRVALARDESPTGDPDDLLGPGRPF